MSDLSPGLRTKVDVGLGDRHLKKGNGDDRSGS
jgi:hypothetical protein